VETLGQVAVALAIFAAVVVIAYRRGRVDPVERLWIPIAVAVLPIALVWVLTNGGDNGRLVDTVTPPIPDPYRERGIPAAVIAGVVIGVLGSIAIMWRESGRTGARVQEFREAVAISVFAGLFGLSWFLFAGDTASWLALPMSVGISSLGWVRYRAARRGGWR
jgi:hypothetical protein